VDGKVVLTPFVLPGETVAIETLSEKKGLIRARPRVIVKASSERVKPPCSYFTQCGGCHYQHAPYEHQLHLKREILGEALRRVGKFEPPEIAVVSGEPLEYRNRVQLHIKQGHIGYWQAGSRKLQAIMSCPIAAPAINRALAELRRMAHQPRFPEFLDTIELFTNGEQIQLNVLRTTGRRPARSFFDWCASSIPGSDASFLEYQAAGETFRVGHRSFFQVNRFLMDRLVDLALETAEGDSALDLYAGVGLFSLPLARRFSRVTAVETGQSAVNDLKSNAERAGLTIDTHAGQAEQFLETITEAPDFVLADPPRAGLGKAAVEQLTRLRPARLTLVSCDPSTLARDLGALLPAGYELEALTLIDLFPQTYHIESVARLRLSR
jgi:23S rRNA (uracil1939-C5)-methyltransferase